MDYIFWHLMSLVVIVYHAWTRQRQPLLVIDDEDEVKMRIRVAMLEGYMRGQRDGYWDGYHHGHTTGLARGRDEGLRLLADCEPESDQVAAK